MHNTNAAAYFLEKWARLGAPHPKEFTCDGGKALLTASIKTFTQYSTINEYVQAFQTYGLPHCYIRMDVAHFLKLNVNFLSTITKSIKVKVFYKAILGQLIQCRNMKMSTKIMKSILILANCENDGYLLNTKTETTCEVEKKFLKNLIDPNILNEEDIDENQTDEWKMSRPEDENILKNLMEEDEIAMV